MVPKHLTVAAAGWSQSEGYEERGVAGRRVLRAGCFAKRPFYHPPAWKGSHSDPRAQAYLLDGRVSVRDLRLRKGVCSNTNAARKCFLVPTDQGPYSQNATSEGPFLDFSGGPLVKILPSNAGGAVSMVGELRSHMPCGPKNQNIKQKHYCNK